MRGRKPKPTARRRLEGNPGRRPLNLDEPQLAQPDALADAPPPELAGNDVASAEWARLMPLLRRARAITDGDRGSLLALCQQWAVYLKATSKIGNVMIVRSPSGYPMPNPYIGIANKSLGNCVKLWVELGLTPSARSRVKTSDGVGAPLAPDDPFREFDDPLQTH